MTVSHLRNPIVVASWAALLLTSGSVLAEELKLELHSFVAVGMVEQDVFVEGDDGMVHRVAAADADAMKGANVFGATQSPPFQPMNLTPTESYDKGIDLGMTFGEWLSASGEGSYSCTDGTANIDISFVGLAPNAVYTMWNFIDAEPPTDPWQGILYALGARDGSDATFESDADGNATYAASIQPCLETAGTQTMTGLAVAWHPDGKTHGASPGKLGVDAFAQLMVGLVVE